MGFRKFLSRQPAEAEDPIARLAELGRRGDRPTAAPPSRPNAPLDREAAAVPVSAVSAVKKPAESSGRPVFRREGRRPSYVWLSESSRQARSGWADVLSRPF
jgi:hypothetical protein